MTRSRRRRSSGRTFVSASHRADRLARARPAPTPARARSLVVLRDRCADKPRSGPPTHQLAHGLRSGRGQPKEDAEASPLINHSGTQRRIQCQAQNCGPQGQSFILFAMHFLRAPGTATRLIPSTTLSAPHVARHAIESTSFQST